MFGGLTAGLSTVGNIAGNVTGNDWGGDGDNYDEPEPQLASHEEYGTTDDGGAGHVEYHDDPGSNNSLILMCCGCILFPLCLVLLGWNEQRSLCESKMILQADGDTIVGDCDDASSVEGKFTFFSCPIDMDKTTDFTPQSFNMVGLGEPFRFKSVAAAQTIDMYQCIEHAETEDAKTSSGSSSASLVRQEHYHTNESWSFADVVGSSFSSEVRRRRSSSGSGTATVYRYSMQWSDTYYDSKDYKGTPESIKAAGCPDFVYNGVRNNNPAPPNRGDGEPVSIGRQVEHAPSVVAGAYTVNDENCMKQFEPTTSVDLSPYASSFGLSATTDNIIASVTPSTVAVHSNAPNYLSSCASDRLGCIRISYTQSNATDISVIAKVGASGVTEPFPMDKSWGCGAQDYIRMYPEKMTKDEMIAKLKGDNHALTWALRVVGLLLCWWTMWCCFEPIASAADTVGDYLSYIPVLGEGLESLLEGVVEVILCLFSCSVGCCCGLFVIAIVWVALRPMIGGPLLGGCVVLAIIAFMGLSMANKDPKRMRKKNRGKLGKGGMGYGENYGAAAGGYEDFGKGGY